MLAVAAVQLAALLALAGVAFGFGRRWLDPGSGARDAALVLGLGCGILATLLLGIGSLGQLRPLPIGLVGAAGLALAIAPRGGSASGSEGIRPVRPNRIPRWAVALGLAALAPAFLLGLYPPAAWDETTYHLPFAATFARTGALPAFPDLPFRVFPQLVEVVAGALLAVVGRDIVAHVPQLLALGVATAAIAELAGSGTRARCVAAAAWLGTPLAHYQAATLYIDLAMAAFLILAVVAWERWRATRRRRWLVQAGALAGFAAATKYLALLWVVALVLWPLAERRRPRRARFAAAGLVALAALVALGPWYLRIQRLGGSPVHPFLSGLFGAPVASGSVVDRRLGLDGDVSADELAERVATRLAPRTLATDVVLAPWRLAWERDRFDHQPPLSPWLPLVALAAVAAAWADPAPRWWLATAVLYLALWTAHDPRFQLVTAGLVSAAAGRLAGNPAVRLRPRAWAVLALALALPGPAYAAARLLRQGPIPCDADARSRYLATAAPGYEALAWLARRPGAAHTTVYALYAPYLAYHAPGRLLGFGRGRWAAPLAEARLDDPPRLRTWLASAGADYLLLVGPPLARARLGGAAEFREVFATPRCRLYALD